MALPTAVTSQPVALPPGDVGSIMRRLRDIEQNIENLQVNQRPQAFPLGKLSDCRPLQAAQDGDVPTWSKADGLWLPA